MHDLPVDPLFTTIFQILPDQWIQELLDHVHEQLRKNANNDHLAYHHDDNAYNSSLYLRDDKEKTLLETLWKESKILLLHKNGEPHLGDDGDSFLIIEMDPKDNDYVDLLTHTGVADKVIMHYWTSQ